MTATLEETGLRLAAADSGRIAEWPYATMRYLADEVRHGPVRVAQGEARLTVEDRAFAAALFARAPRLKPRGWRAIAVAAIAAAAVLACGIALWWVLPVVAGEVAAVIPVAWEERLGDDVLQELPWQSCRGAAGQAALDALAERLIAGSGMPYHLQVTVRDTPVVNAFALPGGRIIVLRGLLKAAQSPEEVAGVLAHELTHALKRHPMRNMIAQQGMSLAMDLVTGGGVGGSVGTLLTTLSYTRAAEEEADAGALLLLERAGIDTAGFASFFERLSKAEDEQEAKSPGLGFAIPNYLRTHPATEQRLAAVRAHPAHGTRPALTPEQWQALKAICGEPKK